MRHPFLFAILGGGMLIQGLELEFGGGSFVLVWLGFDFVLLAIAYAREAPAFFGKKDDGSLAWWSWILFLPLHLYTLAVWHLYRLLRREAPFNRVSDSLTIGRRLLPNEVGSDYDNYIDLTAEFSEPVPLRKHPAYRLFPILDASVPRASDLDKLFGELRLGKTFIHCAQGHGRTGLVAAAWLIFNGQARTGAQAMERLQAVRPGLRLNRGQHAFLEGYLAGRPGLTAFDQTAASPLSSNSGPSG